MNKKIGFDYWQVISHYPEVFAELSELYLAARHEVHVISAVGRKRLNTVRAEVANKGVLCTQVHEVLFEHPRESPELKLAKCQALGITQFYDDRQDVCRLLNANGIVAFQVMRRGQERDDLQSERT